MSSTPFDGADAAGFFGFDVPVARGPCRSCRVNSTRAEFRPRGATAQGDARERDSALANVREDAVELIE